MNSISARSVLIILSLSYASIVSAASINTTRSNIKHHQMISLDRGNWCYVVYERGNPKAPSKLIEISTAIDGKCDVDLKVTAQLGQEMALILKEDLPQNSLIKVEPITITQLMVFADGSTNQWPLMLMKNGVVKFFNEAKKDYSTDPYVEDTQKSVLLNLPSELKKVIDEAAKDEAHILIIIRDVKEGKKGLNAVNVKLA
jgi:hypothetical protein